MLPSALSQEFTLPRQELIRDRKESLSIGPCAIGKKALYLSGPVFSRRFYIPVSAVRRVFKRVAMSRGGFSGKGIFGSLSYLVVIYGDGREKQCSFKDERQVDAFLKQMEKRFPSIPRHSERSEAKLREAAAREETRYLKKLSPEAAAAKERLEKAEWFLKEHQSLCDTMARKAKQKRMAQFTNPYYRPLALLLTAAGAAAIAFGIWAFVEKRGFAIYFVLFGFAAILLLAASRVSPTRAKNKDEAEREWREAEQRLASVLPKEGFPLPARYAHPYTVTRMIRIIREGRAENEEQAFEVLKEDLRAMNASVQVDQRDYDEVIVIKPMFLACDYQ